MMEPIEANYVPDGDDWTITIVGRGKTLTAKAVGLIAARDRADQLVDELAGEEKNRTVVHRLDGDALQFTTAYLSARLAKPEVVPEPEADKPVAPEKDQAPDKSQAPAKDKATEPDKATADKTKPAATKKDAPARAAPAS
jgi:hypothetical protein